MLWNWSLLRPRMYRVHDVPQQVLHPGQEQRVT